MDNGIQVVVAEDHAILLDGLRKLLEAEQGFEVVGEASNGDEAVEITQRVEPDILLLDLAMPGPAREVLRQLSDRSLPTRTIILAASIKRDELVKALQLGARGIVMKESVPELLTNAIRTVIAGRYWVGRESVSELIDALQMRPRPTIQSSAHRSRTRDYVDRDCRSHQLGNRKKIRSQPGDGEASPHAHLREAWRR